MRYPVSGVACQRQKLSSAYTSADHTPKKHTNLFKICSRGGSRRCTFGSILAHFVSVTMTEEQQYRLYCSVLWIY